MPVKRPAKYFRLNFANTQPQAFMVLMAKPNEVKIGASDSSFLSVREDGITVSLGKPGQGKMLVQAMPDALRFGGIISELPFPLSLMPPAFAPSQQTIRPPMEEMMSLVRDFSFLTSSFLGA